MDRYDIDEISEEELGEILEVKRERELNMLVATYVVVDSKKIMISQYKCDDYYTTIQDEDGSEYLVTLLDDESKIVGDILNVTKVNKVNDVRTELYIEL